MSSSRAKGLKLNTQSMHITFHVWAIRPRFSSLHFGLKKRELLGGRLPVYPTVKALQLSRFLRRWTQAHSDGHNRARFTLLTGLQNQSQIQQYSSFIYQETISGVAHVCRLNIYLSLHTDVKMLLYCRTRRYSAAETNAALRSFRTTVTASDCSL